MLAKAGERRLLRQPAYRRISARVFWRGSLTAVNDCCDPFDVLLLV
jgi:hypothetical protein